MLAHCSAVLNFLLLGQSVCLSIKKKEDFLVGCMRKPFHELLNGILLILPKKRVTDSFHKCKFNCRAPHSLLTF